jgi:hypothetical protein
MDTNCDGQTFFMLRIVEGPVIFILALGAQYLIKS